MLIVSTHEYNLCSLKVLMNTRYFHRANFEYTLNVQNVGPLWFFQTLPPKYLCCYTVQNFFYYAASILLCSDCAIKAIQSIRISNVATVKSVEM